MFKVGFGPSYQATKETRWRPVHVGKWSLKSCSDLTLQPQNPNRQYTHLLYLDKDPQIDIFHTNHSGEVSSSSCSHVGEVSSHTDYHTVHNINYILVQKRAENKTSLTKMELAKSISFLLSISNINLILSMLKYFTLRCLHKEHKIKSHDQLMYKSLT